MLNATARATDVARNLPVTWKNFAALLLRDGVDNAQRALDELCHRGQNDADSLARWREFEDRISELAWQRDMTRDKSDQDYMYWYGMLALARDTLLTSTGEAV